MFGDTLEREHNVVVVGDIRYNPWASEDILKLDFNGVTHHPVIIKGEGLCNTAFEITFG